MALNIKNQDVEKLLDEVVMMTGESKTEAVRPALLERRQRLALRQTHRKDENYIFTMILFKPICRVHNRFLGRRASNDKLNGGESRGIT